MATHRRLRSTKLRGVVLVWLFAFQSVKILAIFPPIQEMTQNTYNRNGRCVVASCAKILTFLEFENSALQMLHKLATRVEYLQHYVEALTQSNLFASCAHCNGHASLGITARFSDLAEMVSIISAFLAIGRVPATPGINKSDNALRRATVLVMLEQETQPGADLANEPDYVMVADCYLGTLEQKWC